MSANERKQSPAVAARNEAVKALITEHREEYEEFLKTQREIRGLAGDPMRQKKEEQLRKAEERAEKLREELGVVSA